MVVCEKAVIEKQIVQVRMPSFSLAIVVYVIIQLVLVSLCVFYAKSSVSASESGILFI